MNLPIALTLLYLAAGIGLTVWIAREEGRGRPVPGWLGRLSFLVRYGPPLAGLLYLVTIAGDWPFFLFVVGFLFAAFYLLDRLLNFPERPPPRR